MTTTKTKAAPRSPAQRGGKRSGAGRPHGSGQIWRAHQSYSYSAKFGRQTATSVGQL